ncbi:MAG: hypothetical protein ACKV2U_31975 [Bryobacteraceae bacterium]
MPKGRTAAPGINPTLRCKVAARAKAENRTRADCIEAALRENLERPSVTVILHPKLRKTIRRSKPVPRPGASRAERKQEEVLHRMLDVAGVSP